MSKHIVRRRGGRNVLHDLSSLGQGFVDLAGVSEQPGEFEMVGGGRRRKLKSILDFDKCIVVFLEPSECPCELEMQ